MLSGLPIVVHRHGSVTTNLLGLDGSVAASLHDRQTEGEVSLLRSLRVVC